jgi:hypothetical protein
MSANYEAIRQRNIEEYGKGSRHLSYFSDIYSTRTHFIYELLQNAEDALSRRQQSSLSGYIDFRVFANRLEVRHNGAPFVEDETRKDVSGICGIGEGTKSGDYTQIGKFGIGFKSVYAYTFCPRIHSGGEHFEIRRFVEPHGLQPDKAPSLSGDETCIVLPFDTHESQPDWAFRDLLPNAQAAEEIGRAVQALGARTLLFLRHIEEIRWTLGDGISGHVLKEKNNSDTVQVTDGSTLEEWKKFQRSIPIKDGESSHNTTVEVAFLIKDGKIRRSDGTELVAYFPTEKETKLGFLIQAPFKTTKARDNIKSDDPANLQIIQTAAELAAESLETLCAHGLVDVFSYLALPLRTQDFPESNFFRPIYDRVREALQIKPLLPGILGTFVKTKAAKLARGADLVDLFSPQQLQMLFDKEELQWLDSAITESGPLAEFHTYLVGRKQQWGRGWDVPPIAEGLEIDAESLVTYLTADFLAVQDTSWLLKFILYARDNQALRKTPLIRLEGRQHVRLPTQGLQPTAYFPPKDASGIDLSTFPIISPELAEHGDVRAFLQKEGIRSVDQVAIVESCILPKFEQSGGAFKASSYRADLLRIREALSDAADVARQSLTGYLNRVAWVACVYANGTHTETVVWRKPASADVFQKKNEHEIWFNEIKGIEAYFLHPIVDEVLGSEDAVRLAKPNPNLTQKLSLSETDKVSVDNFHGWHCQGLDGFHPEASIVGLDFQLQCWNNDKAKVLWNILLLAPRIICGYTQSASNAQRLDAGERIFKHTPVGKWCTEQRWLPNESGSFQNVNELFLSDIPKIFETDSFRAKEVARRLGLRQPVEMASVAESLGVHEKELQQFCDLSPEARQRAIEAGSLVQTELSEAFPERPIRNKDLRQQRVQEQAQQTPDKETQVQPRLVAVGYEEAKMEARLYLQQQYTNDNGVMFCQICKSAMPFRVPSGSYYFEAVELANGQTKRYREAFLALCPNHAAMYQHANDQKDDMKHLVEKQIEPELEITLGEQIATIRFTEMHLADIKACFESKK